MSLPITPKYVYRRWKTDGVPESKEHFPDKAEIVQLLERMEDNIGVGVSRATLEELNAVTPKAGTFPRGEVTTGPDAGWYNWTGSAWAFGRAFPSSFARLTITGGTRNAIQATSSADPMGAEAFIIELVDANTAAVTISINGGPYIPVLSVDGDDYEPGEFTGRMMLENLDSELLALTADPGVIAALVEEATSVAPGTWQLLRDETIAARGVAQAAAGVSVEKAGLSNEGALRAEAAASQAGSARDASFIGNRVETINAGIANTPDGQPFVVIGSGDVAGYPFKRNGASATPLGPAYPSVNAIGSRALASEDALKTGDFTIRGQKATDGGGFQTTDNFKGWAMYQEVPTHIAARQRLDQFQVRLAVAANAATVRLRVFRRLSTIANLNSPPDFSFHDVLVETVVKTVAELGLVPGSPTRVPCGFDVTSPMVTYNGDMFITAIEAFDGSGNPASVGIGSALETGASQRYIGWYRNPAGTSWGNVDSTTRILSWAWLSRDLDQPQRTKAELETVKSKLSVLLTTIGENMLGTALSTSSWGISFGFGRFAGGFDAGGAVSVGGAWDAITLSVNVPSAASKMQFKVWRRPLSVSDPNAVIGTLPEDLALVTFTKTLAQLGLTAGDAAFKLCTAIFPTTVTVEAGFYYCVEFEAQNSAGVRQVTGAAVRNGVDPATAQRLRGYFAGNPTNALVGVSSTTSSIYWRAEHVAYGGDPALTGRVAAAEDKLTKLLPTIDLSGLVLPPKLWLTQGRPLPINWMNCLPYFYEGDGVVASIHSTKTGQIPFLREGKYSLEVDPDRLGSSLSFVFRRTSDAEERKIQTIPVTIAPAAKTGSPKQMTLGDSLMVQYVPVACKQNLVARGMAPVFLGTKTTSTWNGEAVATEAKGSSDFGDWTYRHTDFLQPLPVGQEAAYLAMNNTQKGVYNPFLRATTGSDPAQRIFNGYIFDLAFYCTRFGLALPDFFTICLGQNSLYAGTTEMQAEVDTGMETLIGQIRAAAPNCQIAFFTLVQGRSGQNPSIHKAMQARVANYIRASADAKLTLLPAWLHMSEEAGWQWEAPSSTSPSGLQTVVTNIVEAGDIHQHRPNVEIVAEVMASWIASLA